MKVTFYETYGAPGADGECTAVRTGEAELSIAQDTLLNQTPKQLTCRLNGHDFVVAGPTESSVWVGFVNPNTRSQRRVLFAELKRKDGEPYKSRIVLLDGYLQRGEAIMEVAQSSGTAAVDNEGLVCFTRESCILTAFGDLPIEHLRVGDLVHTADNGLQPVRWIGSRDVSATKMRLASHLHPVKIKKDAFGPGIPHADTWVSQQHRMLLVNKMNDHLLDDKGVLAPAIGLTNNATVTIDPALAGTQYIHMLFDAHEVVFVNGLASESFFPSPTALMSLTQEDRNTVLEMFPRLENHPLSYGTFARTVIQPPEARILAA